MVGLPQRSISAGQAERAKALIRLLKQYLKERADNGARRAIGETIAKLAAEMADMCDAGGIPPMPQGHRPQGPKPFPIDDGHRFRWWLGHWTSEDEGKFDRLNDVLRSARTPAAVREAIDLDICVPPRKP